MQAVNPKTSSQHPSTLNKIIVHIDGIAYDGFEGQTVAAILAHHGIRTFRYTQKSRSRRGIYCGMGVCFECLVTINGVPNQRACVTLAAPEMEICLEQKGHNETQR
jgi:hypothetical protein